MASIPIGRGGSPGSSSSSSAQVLSREGLQLKKLAPEDVDEAYKIERDSYPSDEAATLEGMTYRQKNAGLYFYGLYMATSNRLIGFVNGTCSHAQDLEHHTMSNHDEGGETLCIHSVTILAEYRRRGYASAMLREYVQQVLATTTVYRLRLLSKAYLLGFYQSCGFIFLWVSPVQHGQETWFELGLDRVSVLRRRPYYQVDAFTSKAFGGNPAAVVMSEPGDTDEWMQSWGMENNLSETAFLQELSSGDEGSPARYNLRWFTPTVEVDLCGHATLASAHALWATRRVPPTQAIEFETKSGILGAITVRSDSSWIELNFPVEPPTPLADSSTSSHDFIKVKAALACTDDDILYIGRSRVDLLVEVTPRAFRDPDISILKDIECRGVILTTAGGQYDFQSRFFGPRCGIQEDPVTGSAHCCLAPYWMEKLGGKNPLTGFQASKRGGVIKMEVDGARVRLRGQAVLVKEGYFLS